MDKASQIFTAFMFVVAIAAYLEDYQPSSLGRVAQACIERCDTPLLLAADETAQNLAAQSLITRVSREPASITKSISFVSR